MTDRATARRVRCRWTAALAVASVTLLPARAEALPRDTWVVAIGNNHGEPDDVSLLFAERDAQEVAKVFRSLADVPSDRIVQLADEDADAVRRTLGRVSAAIRAQGSDQSALIVYYSGHADADRLHLGSSHLTFDELRSLVKQSTAKFRLLVVDACRSGGISRVKGVTAAEEFRVDVNTAVAEGTAVITSSAANESSQESDRLQGSFFSHHFVQALRGAADENANGEVTLSEAYAYAYAETVRSSGSTLELQHPTYSWEVKGRADVVLTRPRKNTTRQGLLRLGNAVTHLIYEGGGLVAEVHPQDENALVALPPRHYRIQERLADEYRNYDVQLGSGQTVALADRHYESIRYDRLVRKGGGEAQVIHGAFVYGGARGQVIDGEGVTPHLNVGYTAATRWFTVEGRVRLSRIRVVDSQNAAPRTHDELGLALGLHRFIDLESVSLSFGVQGEATWHRQRFHGNAAPPDRNSTSAGFGAVFGLEHPLWEGLAVHAEGGPATVLLKGGEVEGGRETRTETRAELTWWLAAGGRWRF